MLQYNTDLIFCKEGKQSFPFEGFFAGKEMKTEILEGRVLQVYVCRIFFIKRLTL